MIRNMRYIGLALGSAAALGCSTGPHYNFGTTSGQAAGTNTGGSATTGGSGTTGGGSGCSNDGQCTGQQTDAGVMLPRCGGQGVCVQCLANTDCSNQGYCDPGSDTCLPSCVTDPSQCSGTQVCNPQTGGCVGCLHDSDCTVSEFPHCAPSGPLQNQCVQCLAPNDCPENAPGCNTESASCGSCSAVGDCPGGLACNEGTCNCTVGSFGYDAGCTGDTPICLPGVGGGTGLFCGCNDSAQCDAGQICDNLKYSNGLCVSGCTPESCASNPQAPLCAPSGLCVFCLDNSGCADAGIGGISLPYCAGAGFCGSCQDDTQCIPDGGTPHCYSYYAQCVQCIDFTQCPANEPGCDSLSHQCFRCHQDGDCNQAQGFQCDPGTHLCRAGCASGISCPPSQPFCDSTSNLCKQCQADADCIGDGGVDAGPSTACNALGFCGDFGQP
jgi:hypothetical protein